MWVYACGFLKGKIQRDAFPFVGFLLCIAFYSCGSSVNPPEKNKVAPAEYKQLLVNINKYEVAKETDEINQYIARHNWNMETTGTGLRYIVIDKGQGAQPKSGDIVLVNYKIYLLDGTLCYTSEEDGRKEFKVEGDNVESGIHEAILLMHVGGKAKFILPSYRANGLQGDNDKIPPMSAILVDLELVEIAPLPDRPFTGG
jgi:FKBP-type peptidyl-prolyl cis-trans isomerase FkpA